MIVALALYAAIGLAQGGEEIAHMLDAYLAASESLGYFSGSVLIVKHGNIVLEKGYGQANLEHNIANSPHTRFKLSSLAKPFIALAIMQLWQEERLSVHDPLALYITDYPQGDTITIHQLLTHTSGIKNYTAFPDFTTAKKLPTTLDSLIHYFKYEALATQPGQIYKFSSSNYALLCFIIERVTGVPYYEYIADHIFKPAGMCNTGYDTHARIVPGRASGYLFDGKSLVNADYIDMSAAAGVGSFYSTVGDLYRFNQALSNGLLLSHDFLNRMLTPYAQIGDREDGIQYGYGWATISLAGHEVKKHIGTIDGFSTAMYRFVDQESYIIVLSNFEHALTEPMSFDLAAMLYDKPYEMPAEHKAIAVAAAILQEYVGDYWYKGLVYMIRFEDGKLYFKQPNKTPYTMLARSEREFFICGVPIALRFVKNSANQVVHMVTKAFGKERVLKKTK